MSSIKQSSNSIRFGLALFLSLMLYDGALRKWGFPGGEQLIFIIKDVVLLVLIVFGLGQTNRHANSKIPGSVSPLMLLYALWVLLEIANPGLPNLAVGIWGLKSHLLYVGIVLLLPIAFHNLDDFFRVVRNLFPMVVIPICVMAFFQVALPADSLLNLSIKGDTEATAYFGEASLVRVTGTFSYISGMAAFVQTFTLLGVGLFLGGARKPWFLIGLTAIMATLPATGSRGVLVSVIASVFLMLIATAVSRLAKFGSVLRVVATTAILMAISGFLQQDAWVAILQRSFGDAGDEGRAFTAFTNALEHIEVGGFFGFGTGAANLGALALVADGMPFWWLPIGGAFEEESGRIVLELGIIGWVFSLAMRLALLAWAMSLLTKVSTHASRLAVVIALPTIAYGVWVGNGVFAVPLANFYFWFCVALLAMAQNEKADPAPQLADSSRHTSFHVTSP